MEESYKILNRKDSKELTRFLAREGQFDGQDILIVYIDGIRFDEHHVIGAVEVNSQGFKQVLGLVEGSTENATIVKDLLHDLVSRGLDPALKRLFLLRRLQVMIC
jgi:transposase-like protein